MGITLLIILSLINVVVLRVFLDKLSRLIVYTKYYFQYRKSEGSKEIQQRNINEIKVNGLEVFAGIIYFAIVIQFIALIEL